MLRRILAYRCASSGATTAALSSGAPLALLVNNLGGSSSLEMGAVAHEALGWLQSQGVRQGAGCRIGFWGGGDALLQDTVWTAALGTFVSAVSSSLRNSCANKGMRSFQPCNQLVPGQ
jgi:hypothetical protein